jgi:polyisoprenoid-binding protein YceI
MSLPNIPAGTWTVDPVHSRVGFVARHMMVSKVRGSFTDYTAEVTVAEAPLESKVTAVVQMASIDTGNGDRDGHLRTNDFFDIEQFPEMSLVSTGFAGDGTDVTMTADLTVKGITKPVEFELEVEGPAQDPWGGTRIGVTATATINRKDWGIEWNAALETGGVMLGDKIQIDLDLQLVKA